ncbi:MAG TPA: DUF4159 domain-containing protein [Roseiarcus sp.]|jgi:hypothetical protein
MLGLPIAFAAPAVLAALALLAALYLFLRITPPRPRQAVFPPLRLLLGIDPRDATPAKTPWPLLALRIAIAALVILAMAGPMWNLVQAGTDNSGPLLVLIDDGWPAAPAWERRLTFAHDRLRAATEAGRLAAIVPMSQGGLDISPLAGPRIEEKLRALQPVAYAPERQATLPAITRFLQANPHAEIVWIADGIERGGAGAFARALSAVAAGHTVSVVVDRSTPLAISSVENLSGALTAHLTRTGTDARGAGVARALDAQGRSIGEAPFAFGANKAAVANFDLPVELRNQVSRVVVGDENSAGAVWLMDEREKRRRVAILSGSSADVAQPLLSPVYYIRRALAPYAELREWRDASSDPILSLLAEKPSVMVLADMSVPPGPAHEKLLDFVESGGVLLRFAGTRLAAGDDDLTPTVLRRGGRTLGGALSWETPKHIAPFDKDSPFLGLAAPDEVTVSRQVLAEPEPGLAGKTWARLADGTPLVTAAPRGKGLIVLFHVTADTTWSNLPLSGLFVEMLRRIVARAGAAPADTEAATTKAETQATRAPYRTLDGFGVLGAPPATAAPIGDNFSGPGDAAHPPGFYGAADALEAVNAMAPGETLARADYAGLPVTAAGLDVAAPIDLKPWLLLAAFIGFLVDGLANLWLGRAPRYLGPAAAMLLVGALAGATLAGPRAFADEAVPSDRDAQSARATHLAYIVTGDPTVDETSRLGLENLGRVLDQRTSAEVADPIALDPARDELSFYPLIYWPIVANRPQPGQKAVARISAFMKNGGTVIFDTRDALTARAGGPPTPEGAWLQTLLAGVDVPELEPVPRDHVITKTFYLIDRFVGRTDSGVTWVEALPPPDPNDRAPRPARAGDSVSPIVITSNDLAAAWAVDANGQPLYPLIPGGPRQQEMALRGGVNLVMYTLTGNYKADQVHAKDLLERLSH